MSPNENQSQLDPREARLAVEETQQRLITQYELMNVLIGASTLSEAIPQLLECIARNLRMSVGIWWQPNEVTHQILATHLWRDTSLDASTVKEFEEATLNAVHGPEEGMPGWVWARGQVQWLQSDVQDARFQRLEQARQDGLQSALWIPITIGTGPTTREVLGVLEFVSLEKATLHPSLLRDMQTVSHQIGQFAEKAAAQAALRKSNEELETKIAERTEALVAANQELESFSYSVSHDLRSPLRSIDGFSQALLEDYGPLLDGQGKKFLDYVREDVQRMGRLIDDLLNLSRLTRSELTLKEVPLCEVADKTVSRLRQAEPARQVKFSCEPDLKAFGDSGLLSVLLENLLGNAWKFTAKKVDAHIEFGRVSDTAEKVYFVRDNGAGFDMAYYGKLFGAFQRLHSPGEFKGSGIGLATVRRVVHRHGGRIWAEGAPNQGATFYFTLPLQPRNL